MALLFSYLYPHRFALLSYADQYDEHRKSLTTAGAYIRVPDGEPNEVCKEGERVWVGFAPLDSGDAENVLLRFRWRFTKTRDMVRISSVFCEGIGEYVLSPENGIDSDIVLKEWFQPVGRQSFKKDQLWINWLPTNAVRVRQFRSLSCTDSCAIRGPICIVSMLNGVPPNCRLQLRRTNYSADQVRLPAICLVMWSRIS